MYDSQYACLVKYIAEIQMLETPFSAWTHISLKFI